MLAPCGRALLSALVAFFIYANAGSVGAETGLVPLSPRIYIYPMPDSYREYNAPAAFVSMYRCQHVLGWRGAGGDVAFAGEASYQHVLGCKGAGGDAGRRWRGIIAARACSAPAAI